MIYQLVATIITYLLKLNIKHYKLTTITVKCYRRFSEINFEILHNTTVAHIMYAMMNRPTVYLSIELNCSIFLKENSGLDTPKENK